jgi:phytoene synthase
MYADQHRLIRERGYDGLSARPTLTVRRRLGLVARAWLHWQFSGDPLAAFYEVTDLETPTDAGEVPSRVEYAHDPSSGSD